MRKDTKKAWREKYPMQAAYSTLRDNAKRRHIPFEITYEEFKQFAFKTKLLSNRNKGKYSYSIDRIDGQLGYTKENLQVLTLSDNGYKGFLEREIYYEEGTGFKSKLHKVSQEIQSF